MNCRTIQWGAFPSLQRRGGCGTNKKSRSHRSAADGVVAYKPMFQNVFPNITCERPPRPRRFGTEPFFDGADTLLRKEENMLARNSFTASRGADRRSQTAATVPYRTEVSRPTVHDVVLLVLTPRWLLARAACSLSGNSCSLWRCSHFAGPGSYTL